MSEENTRDLIYIAKRMADLAMPDRSWMGIAMLAGAKEGFTSASIWLAPQNPCIVTRNSMSWKTMQWP